MLSRHDPDHTHVNYLGGDIHISGNGSITSGHLLVHLRMHDDVIPKEKLACKQKKRQPMRIDSVRRGVKKERWRL